MATHSKGNKRPQIDSIVPSKFEGCGFIGEEHHASGACINMFVCHGHTLIAPGAGSIQWGSG